MFGSKLLFPQQLQTKPLQIIAQVSCCTCSGNLTSILEFETDQQYAQRLACGEHGKAYADTKLIQE
jgi:hypothetical protein